jgi:uncharacterized protein YrrD
MAYSSSGLPQIYETVHDFCMQLRISTAIGTPIVEQDSREVVGSLHGILIHPDSGKIEGFFVAVQGFFSTQQVFLSALDIRSWGLRITIADRDVLAEPEERIRLRPLLEDPRTFLGQRMRTESGQALGRCRDVQFDTRHLQVEWLFPKKFGRWKTALPISEVIEVRPDAIIVRDPLKAVKEPVVESNTPLLNVPEMA